MKTRTTGRIADISRSLNGKFRITFEVDDQPSELSDDLLDITFQKHREARSLDANGLMWVCLQQIAQQLGITKWDAYLRELKEWGQFTYIVVKERAVEDFRKMWRETEIVGKVNINGQTGVQLLCYYGSHLYNTKEFSVLLDGIIQDMKSIGLQPPASKEMQQALALWEKEHSEVSQQKEQGD